MPIWLFFFAVACDCGGEVQRVAGEHPYVRCSVLEAEDQVFTSPVGSLEDQVLSLDVERLEIFSLRASSLSWLERTESRGLQVVIGGFARSESNAVTLLRALAERGPALLLLGGEDDTEILDDALDEVSSSVLVDLRGIRRVELGESAMVVLHGTADGRYGLGDNVCGFSADDLGTLSGVAQTGDHLLSWMAPAGGEYNIGLLGEHVGSEVLQNFAAEEELLGGVHAWPREQSGFVDAEAQRFVVGSPEGLQVDAWGGRFLGKALLVRVDGEAWSVVEED